MLTACRATFTVLFCCYISDEESEEINYMRYKKRMKCEIQHGKQADRPPYLTLEEEVVKFLIKYANIGYPYIRAQDLALVQ